MTFGRSFAISALFCALFWITIIELALKYWPGR